MSVLNRITFASVAMFALAACSEDVLSGTSVARVRVLNDSQLAVSNVKITTGEGSDFTIASLLPGATSAEHSVEKMHQNPMISLTAGGKSLVAHPVEGFSGFNPPLPAGNYLIKIEPRVSEGVIAVSVSQIVEQSK